MSVIRLECPPLPFYQNSGGDVYTVGRKHISRQSLGVFDLLVVTQGCLYMGEEERQWRVESGMFLLLRPDRYHYAWEGCDRETHFHWLHFRALGEWSEESQQTKPKPLTPFSEQTPLVVTIPRFGQLKDENEVVQRLETLRVMYNRTGVRLEHQIEFQHILLALGQDPSSGFSSSVRHLAGQAVVYLREHFREPFRNDALGTALNFHPMYITRCFRQVYGCTPLTYMTKFRIEQAKQLLTNSDLPIGRIAEQCGFETFSFFTRCFHKHCGVSPREYRNRTVPLG
jgi:AraC-like DNA-binding protein